MTIRNLKFVCLVLAALLALGVALAQGETSQVEHEFESAVEPTALTGAQENEDRLHLATGGIEITDCKEVNFAGTAATATADSIALHPTFNGCAFLSEFVAVDTNHCLYRFDSDTDAKGHAKLEMTCDTKGGQPGAIEISLFGGACILTITPAQVNKAQQGVHYYPLEGPKEEITIDMTITGTSTTSAGMCFGIGSTPATYSGGIVVAGYIDEGNSGTEFTPHLKEGAQVNFGLN